MAKYSLLMGFEDWTSGLRFEPTAKRQIEEIGFKSVSTRKTDFGQSRDQILLVPWQLKFCDWRDIYENQQVYFVCWERKVPENIGNKF